MTDEQKLRLLSLVGALARAQPINRMVCDLKALVDEIVAAPADKVPTPRLKPPATRRKRSAKPAQNIQKPT
jgi:hypothetical protein